MLILDGQGVDVRPKSDRLSAELVASGKPGQNAGASCEAGSVLDAGIFQFPGDDFAGPSFFVRDLGVGMKITSDDGDVLEQGLGYRHRLTFGVGGGRRMHDPR